MIAALDVDTIYKVPLWLHAQGLDDIVDQPPALETGRPADLCDWSRGRRLSIPRDEVTIAVVGKYVDLQDAYKSHLRGLAPRRPAPARPRAY